MNSGTKVAAKGLLYPILAVCLMTLSGCAPSDQELKTNVQREILSQMKIDGVQIEVAAQDGVVTLSGTVESDLRKEQAGKIAGVVEDVKQVNNQLEVLAVRPVRSSGTTRTRRRKTSSGSTRRKRTTARTSSLAPLPPKPTSTKTATTSGPKGTVQFSSFPRGSAVYVDGKRKGTTPITLSLSAGKHRYTIQRQGYEPHQGRITVTAGRHQRKTIALSPESIPSSRTLSGQ
ncbi:MAG: BON domain-containing protein [Acidobacteria bacterium]|nr:BON domain-containing protein [Acidobacteriota bacterium]